MYNSAADFRGVQSMTIRARLLHNPVAGTMPSRRFVQRAERVLRRLGWEIEVSSTSSQEEVAQIAWQSAKEHFDVFVVATALAAWARSTAACASVKPAFGSPAVRRE
jgi:phosphoribosylcarboxyaminoimidazole (NCAIR) mutase